MKKRSIILVPESQWEKIAKLRRGEIITFGKFKVITSGSKDKAGGSDG